MTEPATVDTTTKAPTSEPKGELTSALAAEIEANVTSRVEKLKGDDDGPTAEDLERQEQIVVENAEEQKLKPEPKDDELPADELQDGDEPKGLSDELKERAIRAGLSFSEVNEYSSESLLEKVVSRMEGAKEELGSHGDAGKADTSDQGGSSGGEDDLPTIPDLDPDEYDEKIVAGFKSFKEIIDRQNAIIAELRNGGQQDWLGAQLDGVKDYTKGDPEKTEAVAVKFKVLEAGYKAAGQDVTREAVFEEAAKLVLGSDIEAAKLEKKGKAARRRSGQRIARPSGRKAEAKADVFSETAAMLDRKFGT